jgi:hypothetical protein
MRSSQPQADFLKTLLLYGDTEERRRLIAKVVRASREERWSRRGLCLTVLLTLAYFYGLSYAPVGPVGTIFEDPSVWGDLAAAGGVGLVLCVAVFLGHWVWQRGFLHRVEDESRRFVLGVLESCSRSRGPRLPLLLEQTFGMGESRRQLRANR